MPGKITGKHGGTYTFVGPILDAVAEYERFQGCLLQLVDDSDCVIGNLEGRWVIFKDGWVYGFCSYQTEADAISFGRQIFRDEPWPSYIIVQVEPEQHCLSAMHLLASALSDVESNEIRRRQAEEGE